MRTYFKLLCTLIVLVFLVACSDTNISKEMDEVKVGIMLSDAGLGDQSFSDLGFAGLEKSRDELNISFDYREIKNTKTYEQGLEELVEDDNDLIIGLGFSIQEAMEKVAKKYPEKTFMLVDAKSDLPNVYNITFKEEEASYLIGAIAGMKTKSNVVGFIGGEKNPIIQKFEDGFFQGVKAVNPKAVVLNQYANSFGDDQKGRSIAKEMIAAKADFIYPAAGFTGVGAILEAQRSGAYSFGVDSDQFYLAEKAIVTSMMKQVDIAVFDSVKELVESDKITEKNKELGLKEAGVTIAPIRIIELSSTEQDVLEKIREDISTGTITINK